MDKEEYKKLADRKALSSSLIKDCCFAFLFGGTICAFGQLLLNFYLGMGLTKDMAGTAVSVTLIFIGVLLTGLNIYPKIAKYAGAGTIVPITGFANSVAAPAIEARTEGFVLGVAAKIFTIAGPVIVFGVGTAFVAGICLYVSSLI